MVQHVPIQFARTDGHFVDRRFELNKVDPFNPVHLREPTGRFAGPQSDNEGSFRIAVQNSA